MLEPPPPPNTHTGLWSIGRCHFTHKYRNFKMGSKLISLMVKSIHDSLLTVWNILVPIWEIFYGKHKKFIKSALFRSIFEQQKCSFSSMGQNFTRNWLVPLSVKPIPSLIWFSIINSGWCVCRRVFRRVCRHMLRNESQYWISWPCRDRISLCNTQGRIFR